MICFVVKSSNLPKSCQNSYVIEQVQEGQVIADTNVEIEMGEHVQIPPPEKKEQQQEKLFSEGEESGQEDDNGTAGKTEQVDTKEEEGSEGQVRLLVLYQ